MKRHKTNITVMKGKSHKTDITAKKGERCKTDITVQKGAITVEAVIILPLYILVILFIINFLNISYLQLTLQQGLNNAGNILAQYCYALDMAVGVETFNTNNIDENVENAKTAFDSLKNITSGIGSLFTDFSFDKVLEIIDQGKQLAGEFNTMVTGFKALELKDIASYLITSGAETGASLIVAGTVDEYLAEMKVNRSMIQDNEIHYRVCMDDETQDIVLIATYRYQSPMFSLFTDGIDMRQVVVVHPWIGGDTDGVRQK